MAGKIAYAFGVLTVLLLTAARPAFAADSFDSTLNHATDWLQGKVVPVAVLVLALGGFLMMVKLELGRRLVMGALVGVLLIIFARPLVGVLVGLAAQVHA